MTILNESGVPDVVSPLRGLYSLAERLPDTLFIVVGTRADAYLIRSLSVPLPGSPKIRTTGKEAHRRVVFVVLEPDEEPKGGALASRVVEATAGFRRVGSVMLVSCRSAGLLGLDADFEAELAERRLGLPVRAVAADVDGSGVLSTDLEDEVVLALVELCPRSAPVFGRERFRRKGRLLDRFRGLPGRQVPGGLLRRPVVLLGALPGSQAELAAELSRAGVEVAGVVPSTEADRLPEIDEETVVAAVDPYLSRACRAAGERGATVVETSPPIGVEGTARFIQDVVAAAAGQGTSEARRSRRVWESLETLRSRIRGKRVFFAGDTGLEVPVARFLVDAGAVVVEVGTPRLEKRSLTAELAALADVDVVESPEWRAQLDRVDAARPDLVVASPGLYVPLVARGHLCRSSLDLLSLGVHGYEGARRLLALFALTFEHAEGLDSMDLL